MKLLWLIIIPAKSVNGFCPGCVCAQCQQCPPISRPPPSATNSWIFSARPSLYNEHTNTLRSSLKYVDSHFNPDLLKCSLAWSKPGTKPTTPCRPSSNQRIALIQNGASVCDNGYQKQKAVC